MLRNYLGKVISPRDTAEGRKSLFSVGLLIVTLLWAPIAMNAFAQEQPDVAQNAVLSGRVIDQDGKPVFGARVTPYAEGAGNLVRQVFATTVRTDADGYFHLDLPFSDIRWWVIVEQAGYKNASIIMVPAESKTIELTLAAWANGHFVNGELHYTNGDPAAEVSVEIVDEYGPCAEGKTTAEGRFHLGPIFGSSQSVLIAAVKDYAIPLKILRLRKDEILFATLVRASTISGTITDITTTKPVSDATVHIRPWFSNGFFMEGVSDEDGFYEITDIPPGKYIVEIMSETHYRETPRESLARASAVEIEVPVGANGNFDYELQPRIPLCGVVLGADGKPVIGAVVVAKQELPLEYVHACTGEDGRFELLLPWQGNPFYLAAFSSSNGLVTDYLRPDGWELGKDIVLRQPGAIELKGIVTDTEGQPVKDIKCSYNARSKFDRINVFVCPDETGHFNFGQVSLSSPADAGAQFIVKAPRPAQPDLDIISRLPDIHYYTVESRADAPEFFFHEEMNLQSEPGAALDLNIKLERTELMEFVGTLSDAADAPVAKANIYLLNGDVDAEAAIKFFQDQKQSGHGGGDLLITSMSIILPFAGAKSDEDGHWRMWAVREKKRGEEQPGQGEYIVIAGDGEKRWVVSPKFDMPKGTNRKEINLVLHNDE